MDKLIGKTISHYNILEKLGHGGMGEVYKAEDTKLKRTVALKFLPPELTLDTGAKKRFIHEAQAASALQDNNICTIHDIDENEDGQLFIIMDCYAGESLKEKISRGPMKLEEAIDIALQVARGLGKAHEYGMVHRDIKPANVMITGEGVAKILDFGLAKLAGQVGLTKIGTTIGTVTYMSPEQARGEEVDQRTDLWSLGVMLYQMLTGQLPFKGEYEQAVIYSILNDNPPPARSLRPDIPEKLDNLISRCLEKDPAKRYQTAADLIVDLRYLEKNVGAGIETTRRLQAMERKRIWRMRWGYGLVFVIILAIVVTPVLHQLRWRTAGPAEKSIAVMPFLDMSPQKDQEYFCDGMTEELINRLSNIQTLRVPARTSAFFFKGKMEDIREVGNKLKVQTVLEGSVRKAGNELRITAQLINVANGYHLWSETYDRQLEDVFTIQDEISTAIVNALQLKLTSQEEQRLSEHPIDNVKAYECYLKAERQILRFDEKSLDSAFAYLQTAIDIMGDNAQLYAGMAYAYWQYTNIGIGQEDYLERMEEYARKALALKPNLSSALAMLGMLSVYEDYPQNLYDEFRYLKKALEANPFELRALTGLTFNYALIGKLSEAYAITERMKHHDPLNPWWHLILGLCFQYDCQFGPALEQSRIYYQANSTSPMAQARYAWMLVYNGQRAKALAVIDRIGNAKSNNVMTVFSLLLKYALLKDKEDALNVMTPEFQKTCRRDAEWSYIVAARLSLLGTIEEALDWLENAVNRGFINYPLLQCDSFFENIRSEERFKKLMEHAKYEWEHFEVPG